MKPSDPSQILPRLPAGAGIVILRLRSLGDMVMLTPGLAALHAWRPDLKIQVVAQSAFAAVLEGHPAVSGIIPFAHLLECARALRRGRFPLLFNHHGGPTSALLSLASGVPVRVCWAHGQFGFAYNVRVPGPERFFDHQPVHTVEHRMTQFYWAGLPRGPIPRAQVYPQPDALASAREKLRARGIADRQRYAVIHPGASHPSKQWPIERFAEMALWLLAQHRLRPVIRLGPGDTSLAPAIVQRFPKETLVLGPRDLDLRETIALIAGASFFLGNDSGPAHLATATARPLVVLYGSTDAATWAPWQVPHRVVQAAGPCPQCAAGRCFASSGGRCILAIPFEQVRDACAAMLQNGKERMEKSNEQ